MKFFKIIFIFIIVILVAFRLYLPYFLLHYVERQINKIPEYRAKIADLDVHLYRGSYTLKHLQLWKITNNIPVPYLDAPIIDFSIQWAAILHGKLVAKIIAEDPVINLVTDPSRKNQQLTIDAQWLNIVKSLFPLNINRLDVYDGEIYFQSYHGNPPFKTYIKHVEFTLQNMQTVEEKNTLLPSSFDFSGSPMDGGKMDVSGKFNPLAKQPTFYLKGKLNALKITQIANFLKHYSAIDVVGGTFSLYGELDAAKGNIKGYAKPFFKDLKIGDPKKESLPGMVYNGVAAVAAKILENSQKKTVATKINIEGRMDDPDTSIFSIIGYLLHHAFIQALLPGIDHSVKMQDVIYGKGHQSTHPFREYRN